MTRNLALGALIGFGIAVLLLTVFRREAPPPAPAPQVVAPAPVAPNVAVPPVAAVPLPSSEIPLLPEAKLPDGGEPRLRAIHNLQLDPTRRQMLGKMVRERHELLINTLAADAGH